jgi:hypothetical protein
MFAKQVLLSVAAAALLTAPCFAESHQGGGFGGPHSSGGSFGGTHGTGSGIPHGTGSSAGVHTYGHLSPSWHDFNHNAPPVRVQPHRYGNSVLPVPNTWRGDVHSFDHQHWSGGTWRHDRHNGRYGWWWIVGPDWYYYDAPIYPYPDSYVPPGEEYGWWYWCEAYQEYYPYVTYCPGGWERVLPRD